MRHSVPVSRNGVAVERKVPIGGFGARFSPFEPCGDQLVFVGDTIWVDWLQRGLILFVDLEKSVAAGGQGECFAQPSGSPNRVVQEIKFAEIYLIVHLDFKSFSSPYKPDTLRP
ncbi:hypothetical protein Pelo_9596 [Pelomyxa schiedti]|nr:hypothetical protein Pelo_9596 [Pelomyxa schiedti]